MGYLLKEALKTLCGVNQWSYAVFWKIGCQNPKLLIWEECYYVESASCSRNENPYDRSWVSAEASNLPSNLQAGDKVHLLVNKMMMNNHVNIVGEGLVGRVAFTGNHQWIQSENFYTEAHPPEVLKEVCQQFLGGMQTVAVIPVLPHGVVQFGSSMMIMENMGFINDVTSLILQLGYVSGVLLSPPRIGVPVCLGNSTPVYSSLESNVVNAPCSFDTFNYSGNSGQTELQSNGAAFQASNSTLSGLRRQHDHQQAKIAPPFYSSNQLMNGVAKAEVIPSNSEILKNHRMSQYVPRSNLDLPSSTLNCGLIRGIEKKVLSDCGNQGHFSTPVVSSTVLMPGNVKSVSSVGSVSDTKWAANGNINSKDPTPSEPKNEKFHKLEASNSDHFTTNSSLAHTSGCKLQQIDNTFRQSETNASKPEIGHNVTQGYEGFDQDDRNQSFGFQINTYYDGACVQPGSGDDLFDVLGADFKNKLFGNCWSNWDNSNSNLPSNKSLAASEICSTGQANTESGIFSSPGTDHLLEAVVSKIHSSTMDDIVSCRTTLTNTSSSSAPNSSLPYARFGVSDRELLSIPKYLAKEESGTGSSIYGSQISSWMEKDQKAKSSNSVSTGHSKKPDETSKTNRKRLKPGENPRPRPKDRQMIQDRVKELREIVPNGAKCSIDALLERTIKHMLFLQSVTKHADKLKQTGESKIISKDGGLLLKDNFEGGATWAYEVGSQSMICPIIVEDLNQPRQMLVEMLCEERGLFLEIADIIRGLGLTILKGVMETRNDKIWARFAVEANRDVTRMEIFISLVRLLEQSAKSVVAQPSGMENLMAQQFHQVASVPLTTRSTHGLQ